MGSGCHQNATRNQQRVLWLAMFAGGTSLDMNEEMVCAENKVGKRLQGTHAHIIGAVPVPAPVSVDCGKNYRRTATANGRLFVVQGHW